jgi:hypothetical protein
MDQHCPRNLEGPLVAAASMVARHPEYTVRVVVPQGSFPISEAERAAELAGVDFLLARTAECPTVHFVARHQDRRLARQELGATFRSLYVDNSRPEPRSSAPRPIDVDAFRRASHELALNRELDPEVQLSCDRLLRSGASAHLCRVSRPLSSTTSTGWSACSGGARACSE